MTFAVTAGRLAFLLIYLVLLERVYSIETISAEMRRLRRFMGRYRPQSSASSSLHVVYQWADEHSPLVRAHREYCDVKWAFIWLPLVCGTDCGQHVTSR